MRGLNKKTFYKKLGQKLKAARMRAGISQRELGFKLGMSRENVASIEQGRHSVAVHTLLEMAAVLGV